MLNKKNEPNSENFERGLIWALGMSVLVSATLCIAVAHIPQSLENNSCIKPPTNDSLIGIKKRTAMTWIFKCNENQDTWESFNEYVSDTLPSLGITSLSPLGYALGVEKIGYSPVGTDGSFCDCGEQMEMNFLIPFLAKANGLKVYPLIDAGFYPQYNQTYTADTALYQVQHNLTSRKMFIESAVNKMITLGFDGYNLKVDTQTNVNERNATVYGSFVKDFANALAAAGGKLTSDVLKCYGDEEQVDFMGMTCDVFQKSCIDEVITINTYSTNTTTFEKLVNDDASVVPPQYHRVGIEPTSDTISHNLGFLGTSHRNISKLALWVCSTVPCYGYANGWLGAPLKNWSMIPVTN
eukprot:m.102132 g.102132  ORF g.102132 m.102132 type:complete len:353 (+) comp27385_c1_seq2:254-1312(+)